MAVNIKSLHARLCQLEARAQASPVYGTYAQATTLALSRMSPAQRVLKQEYGSLRLRGRETLTQAHHDVWTLWGKLFLQAEYDVGVRVVFLASDCYL